MANVNKFVKLAEKIIVEGVNNSLLEEIGRIPNQERTKSYRNLTLDEFKNKFESDRNTLLNSLQDHADASLKLGLESNQSGSDCYLWAHRLRI